MNSTQKTLRDIWEERGMSAQELATQAGVSTGTVYRMNNKENVSGRNIGKVCNTLGIDRKTYDSLAKDD